MTCSIHAYNNWCLLCAGASGQPIKAPKVGTAQHLWHLVVTNMWAITFFFSFLYLFLVSKTVHGAGNSRRLWFSYHMSRHGMLEPWDPTRSRGIYTSYTSFFLFLSFFFNIYPPNFFICIINIIIHLLLPLIIFNELLARGLADKRR